MFRKSNSQGVPTPNFNPLSGENDVWFGAAIVAMKTDRVLAIVENAGCRWHKRRLSESLQSIYILGRNCGQVS